MTKRIDKDYQIKAIPLRVNRTVVNEPERRKCKFKDKISFIVKK